MAGFLFGFVVIGQGVRAPDIGTFGDAGMPGMGGKNGATGKMLTSDLTARQR
jgi:hypothetical protein